ncbi:NAD(P)/FAD-dependent oxidoreductase [Patulibacter defluvii]|uniref:NAD(P)/FAD-dependent oxidoreductase n=1 Tax=Patulibacter defluvii TaxID=3095358 RepID=UPI002A74B37E|nr:NAD(P)/FAD-dependent oxidoreductase [Patulibacter sp. DM4]
MSIHPHDPAPATVPRVVIAGAGIAALEAVLALRAHLDDRHLRITLLAPNERFRYPPLAVLEPFGGERSWSLPLRAFADDVGVELHHGVLHEVDVEGRSVRTSEGERLSYDALLIATGARPDRSLDGAVPFRGAHDADRVTDLLDDLAEAGGGSVAFVAPSEVSWSLPLYELALLAATHLRARGVPAEVVVVTHERDPLAVFGAEAQAVARAKLAEHGVTLHAGAHAMRLDDDGQIELADGRLLAADHVVAMPTLRPRTIAGLATDDRGFLPIDEHARVTGAPGVYAAGDVTDGPVKQGGLACQQADAAAEAILADLGHPLRPAPYRPVLRGILLSDDEPAYLRSTLQPTGNHLPVTREAPISPRAWPTGKVVGHHLSPYLAAREDGPRTPTGAVQVGERPR